MLNGCEIVVVADAADVASGCSCSLLFRSPLPVPRSLCLSTCGQNAWQPCSHCRSGDLRVHAHARRMHIRLRCAVLRNSPRPASVRSAAAPILTALGTSGTGKRFSLLVAPYAKSRRRSRRLHGVTRRNTSSAGYSLLVLHRVPPRIRRTAVPSFRCAHDSSLALLPEPP